MTLQVFVFSLKDYQVMEEIVLAVIKDIKNKGDLLPDLHVTEETFVFQNSGAYRVSFKENEVEFREAN